MLSNKDFQEIVDNYYGKDCSFDDKTVRELETICDDVPFLFQEIERLKEARLKDKKRNEKHKAALNDIITDLKKRRYTG